jgi:CheY-like chemotaxis protein
LVRVLVAEDDPTAGQALTSLLRRHEYEVELAADGQQALNTLMSANAPSVVLLDWDMPLLDGLRVARAVRSIPAERYIYLIMVTASDSASDLLTAFASGVDDFLSKPVNPAQLLARIRGAERVLAFQERHAAREVNLARLLDEVQTLRRLLPLCTHCKKARSDSAYWQEFEAYLSEHTGADATLGICPECAGKTLNRPEFGLQVLPKPEQALREASQPKSV